VPESCRSAASGKRRQSVQRLPRRATEKLSARLVYTAGQSWERSESRRCIKLLSASGPPAQPTDMTSRVSRRLRASDLGPTGGRRRFRRACEKSEIGLFPKSARTRPRRFDRIGQRASPAELDCRPTSLREGPEGVAEPQSSWPGSSSALQKKPQSFRSGAFGFNPIRDAIRSNG
jgi:hypothetical protein